LNKNILKTGVQEFIKNNWNADIVSVLLKRQQFKGVSQKELAEQLEATLLDITGGLGIDSYFFSKKIDQVIHCEIDQNLSKIAAHNFKILGVVNTSFKVENGIDFLQKELLWILEKGFEGEVKIKTVNLIKEGQQNFDFTLSKEKIATSKLSLPATYLYEPNAAILKSGGFKSLGKVLGLHKLHEHSHLYTSDSNVDFPGRVFKIRTVVPYNKKALLKLAINKANVTTRNFPEAVATIRKKLKIKDGGNDYLFFTTDINNQRIVIYCQKI